MEVFVFRTGVTDHREIEELAPQLNTARGIHRWSFDLEDHENILRVESTGISPRSVEDMLARANYFCEELPD